MAQTDKVPAPAVASRQAAAPEGFEEFFRTEYRMLIGVAVLAGATPEEAEDAVGQSMIEVLARWRNIRKPRAWARRAVLSNFYKQRNRDNKRREREIKDFDLTAGSQDDSNLVVFEDKQWVEQVLKELPPARREVMAFLVAGLEREEICALLGKTKENVRQHLQLARKTLRSHLEREYGIKQEISPQPMPPQPREEDVQ